MLDDILIVKSWIAYNDFFRSDSNVKLSIPHSNTSVYQDLKRNEKGEIEMLVYLAFDLLKNAFKRSSFCG